MCRITVNGKQSAFSNKLDISASKWDCKYSRVLGKSREPQEVNCKLDKICLGIEECYSKMGISIANYNPLERVDYCVHQNTASCVLSCLK